MRRRRRWRRPDNTTIMCCWRVCVCAYTAEATSKKKVRCRRRRCFAPTDGRASSEQEGRARVGGSSGSGGRLWRRARAIGVARLLIVRRRRYPLVAAAATPTRSRRRRTTLNFLSPPPNGRWRVSRRDSRPGRALVDDRSARADPSAERPSLDRTQMSTPVPNGERPRYS